MAKETDLEYAARRLNEKKGGWLTIAVESGVSYSAVRSIAHGINTNPTLGTLSKLVTYLKAKNK